MLLGSLTLAQPSEVQHVRSAAQMVQAESDINGPRRLGVRVPEIQGDLLHWHAPPPLRHEVPAAGQTGKLGAVRLPLNPLKMDSSVRYLGIEIEGALTLSEGIVLWSTVPPSGAFLCQSASSSRSRKTCGWPNSRNPRLGLNLGRGLQVSIWTAILPACTAALSLA